VVELSSEALFRMLRTETIRLVLQRGVSVMNTTTQGISPLRQRALTGQLRSVMHLS